MALKPVVWAEMALKPNVFVEMALKPGFMRPRVVRGISRSVPGPRAWRGFPDDQSQSAGKSRWNIVPNSTGQTLHQIRQNWTTEPNGCNEQTSRSFSQPVTPLEGGAEDDFAGSCPDRWDVIGLGQAMVDLSAQVEDEFLHRLGLIKGNRIVVSHQERGKVLGAFEPGGYTPTAGGSLSNTLVALARLGCGSGECPEISVAMTGTVGSDILGDFYRGKMREAKVHFLSEPISGGTTGTVIVCTTPDAQRTMLSYQGMSSILNVDEALKGSISRSKILVAEGYLWELPETIDTIACACKKAHEQGVLVALTASDTSCVNRHRSKMWEVLCESADILFSNTDEARALLGADSRMHPAQATELLSKHCLLASVTDGCHGSYLGVEGEVYYIQPSPCKPVDTCGAGDAYAAGILYGLLQGTAELNFRATGNLAARVAAHVVGQKDTRLSLEDAKEVLTSALFLV